MRDRERRIKGMCAAWIMGTIVGVIVLMIILAYTEKAQAAVDISAKYKTTTSLTMRKSPSGKKVKTLKKGTTVRVYEQRGNWLKVKHKSSTGWVLFKNSTGQQNLKRTVDGWVKCGEITNVYKADSIRRRTRGVLEDSARSRKLSGLS